MTSIIRALLLHTFFIDKNMPIEELSKVENILRGIEVYVCSSMPLIFVAAVELPQEAYCLALQY